MCSLKYNGGEAKASPICHSMKHVHTFSCTSKYKCYHCKCKRKVLVLFWETVVFVDSCSLCSVKCLYHAISCLCTYFHQTFRKWQWLPWYPERPFTLWAKTNVSYSGREFQYNSSGSLLVTMARYFTRSCPCRITNWKMTWQDGIFLILMGISC